MCVGGGGGGGRARKRFYPVLRGGGGGGEEARKKFSDSRFSHSVAPLPVINDWFLGTYSTSPTYSHVLCPLKPGLLYTEMLTPLFRLSTSLPASLPPSLPHPLPKSIVYKLTYPTTVRVIPSIFTPRPSLMRNPLCTKTLVLISLSPVCIFYTIAYGS